MSSECLSKLRRGVYDTAQGQQWTSEGVLYQAIDALGHLYACIYRYNRRAGQNRRGRRCGQRGFGQRRFAQSAPTGNAAVHGLDGTNSPGVVTGYPVYPKS